MLENSEQGLRAMPEGTKTERYLKNWKRYFMEMDALHWSTAEKRFLRKNAKCPMITVDGRNACCAKVVCRLAIIEVCCELMPYVSFDEALRVADFVVDFTH